MKLGLVQSLTCLAVGLAVGSAGQAATSQKDLAILSRALGFMEPRLAGTVPTAIVYESGDAASEADAKFIKTGLANAGLKNVQLVARLTSSKDIGGIAGSKVVVVAAGVGNQSAIFAAAAKQGAVTISSDMGCVAAGHCVIGARSTPKVEIVVSKAARQASRVGFSQAFLMLVRED